MRRRPRLVFLLILLLTIVAAVVDWPRELKVDREVWGKRVNFTLRRPVIDTVILGRRFSPTLDLKQGLDLVGGTQLTFQADMEGVDQQDRQAAIEAIKDNIERRVNLFGISEPVIQTAQMNNDYRLIVELPGVEDVNQAIGLIGQTAKLEFRKPTEATQPASIEEAYEPTDLTGADLIRAGVVPDPNTGKPTVSLLFNSEGTKKFADLTKEFVGQQVAIFLDNQPISAPVVKEPILTGQASIQGEFTTAEAKQLASQLNAGALPVPIKVVEQRNIGATLGEESVARSIRAGLLGLGLVVIFMVAIYGKLGLIADAALIIYGLITLMLYKLIPVVLTLPGITGFILSVGMAVDANILIFERLKEEVRTGQPLKSAMELAFGRAWDSIRDANVCTLITCFVLFNPFNWSFLPSTGLVRGFALTLALGIFIGLFTGIIVSRTLIRVFYRA
jgi:preprotein translocase subunit SecD